VYDAGGNLLQSLEIKLGGDTYNASLADIDQDDNMEVILAGSNGVMVFDTKGYGPMDDRITCKRDYRRNNDYGWNYQDTYFTYRVDKKNVGIVADSAILAKDDAGGYAEQGTLTTNELRIPQGFMFTTLSVDSTIPAGTSLKIDVTDATGKVVATNVKPDTSIDLATSPVKLRFTFTANKSRDKTPELNAYVLEFDRRK